MKTKRKYNSPVREQQVAETRERIIAAGAKLVHNLPSWDWKNLTARAVGEGAGVSERTVHRHFSTERKLRDAVLERLVEESGIDLGEIRLGNFGDVAVTVFNYLASFAVSAEMNPDPSQTSVDEIRKKSLLEAVAKDAPHWTEAEVELTAAVLDMLWQPPTLDRLKSSWGFDAEAATRAFTWLSTLIHSAVTSDQRP